MRLLRTGAVALLGLLAFPLAGRAQLDPADPFSFYFGYVVPNQNRQGLATQGSRIDFLQRNAVTRDDVGAGRSAFRSQLRDIVEEELNPENVGIGRLRAGRRLVPRFNDTGNYFPGRR
jgi:hypothetical protein